MGNEEENKQDSEVLVNDEPKLEVSRHDDLETAIDKAMAGGDKPEEKEVATKEEAQAAPVVEDKVDAPAEFNKQEKDAWEKGDRKGIREAWDRVNSSRLKEKYESDNSNKAYKDLAAQITPYIESSALKGKDPTKAMMEALALMNEMHKDPWKVAAEVAKLKGISRPAENADSSNLNNSQITTLQEKLDNLLSEREQEKAQRERVQNDYALQQLGSVYQALEAESHENGTKRYPGLSDNELATDVGSLIRSPDFQRVVQRRIPNPTPRDFIIEAYKACDGKVIEAEEIKSLTNNQSHNDKARKASVSQPGKSVPGNKTSSRTYKNMDDAIDAAIKDLS